MDMSKWWWRCSIVWAVAGYASSIVFEASATDDWKISLQARKVVDEASVGDIHELFFRKVSKAEVCFF